MKDLKQLPSPEKKVAAKVMSELGWSSRQIERMLDVSDTSVIRYAEEPTPDDLKQFEAEFKLIVQDKKNKILYKGLDRIEALIPLETKISEVVKAIEIVEGKKENNTNIAIFNNVKTNQYIEEI